MNGARTPNGLEFTDCPYESWQRAQSEPYYEGNGENNQFLFKFIS